MRSNQFLLTALRFATYTLVALMVGVGVAVFLQTSDQSNLQGRLVPPQQNGVIPVERRTSKDLLSGGYSVTANTHFFFEIPAGVRIARQTFFGGPDTDKVRYWIYHFDGTERANKEAGKLGKALYTGEFGYSPAEVRAHNKVTTPGDNDLLGLSEGNVIKAKKEIASMLEILGPGMYYIMADDKTENGMPMTLYAGLDTDGDELNDYREQQVGTDPRVPDTDGDGIPDGTEVFGHNSTNPLTRDTDSDGLSDGVEDKNHNGVLDTGDTNPKSADSDNDELCDGNGLSSGCPEDKAVQCTPGPIEDPLGGKVCVTVPVSPIYGEDINQNGLVDQNETDPRKPETYGIGDWQWKWNLFQQNQKGRNN